VIYLINDFQMYVRWRRFPKRNISSNKLEIYNKRLFNCLSSEVQIHQKYG